MFWKCSNFITLYETPKVKFSNCSIFYSTKALLDHSPIRCMMIFDTCDRNTAIAPPDLREYMPISEYLKPKLSSLITNTVALRFARTWA